MSSQSRGFLASPEGVRLLQQAKAERGWTFVAIAQRAGVSANTVSRLFHPERGKRVGGESVRAIAGVLGVEVDAIGLAKEATGGGAEAERRIQAALESGATELDLSSLGLTAIPESLEKLVNLTRLYLDSNQLTAIPDSLGKLVSLMELSLFENQLTEIPESLGQLTNLTQLHLDSNQLTTIPQSLGKLANLTELSLYQNQLTTIPDSLGKLANLTKLSLFENQLTAIPESLGKLASLTELSLANNKLIAIPESLGKITNLTQLYLHYNELTAIPESLGQIANLTELSLFKNQLNVVPESLGQLANLMELDLSQNQLMAIPDSLGQLANLTELDLSQNQLTAIPDSLGQLANLTRLYLHQNQLTVIPDSLGQLANLTRLYLHQNQLTVIPDSLGQLTNLIRLSLSKNQLTAIPDSLGRLTNLTELSLYQNQLTIIPESLGQLANLTELYLDKNQLTTIPAFVEKLTKLERLDITHNGLSILPNFLLNLSSLKTLLLHGNKKLGISDEVLGPTDQDVNNGATAANPQDILNYYFRVLAHCQPLNESKLILVGFGAVGKTSLANRLIYQNFDPKSAKTEGIQITQWPITLNDSEDITLHVWDFGGQEIMHSTHQFFLTERSLYLLVLNGRQGHEDADAEYWLELIQGFGGSSPVLVVLNKIQEHPFDVNRGALQQKFPNIRGFLQTDCETGFGIDQLRAAIERETDALEHLRDPFPASWVAIKDRLSAMAQNYISFEQYRELCKTDGETDYGAQDSLAVHLHSLGIALNYKDDPRLRDTHVLNPYWVTSGIYTLLNADELAHAKGEMEAACLGRHLDSQNYPPERHGFLLELMRKFELCFRFQDDEHRYLIPDLLDKQQPAAAAEFDLAQCLNFRYEYPILPEGLLPRFIVRTHVLSQHQLRWRTGVILTFEGNRALVKADPQDRCVAISVDGPMASRRRLLAVIRSDFERIHRSFKFTPKELVPVPGHPDVTVDYKELLVREEHRQTSFDVFTGEGLISLNVRDLLNGVDLEGSRPPTIAMDRHSQALRLFYSYSHKDETLRDELETHLKLLQRQGLIQPWHDRRILPGDEWAGDIDDNLNRADIILLLISADFIASDYCYDLEMKRAMERHQAGEARVIPIIVRPTDWKDTPFSKLQCLPKDGKAVTQWVNRDGAWLNVEQGIKQVAESRRTNRT
ncbi:COR domain-containing protein [Nodosilinea sp. P-1105]|uniref:leucine-rich repeat domain-containing protein n=1 Tax=Nodosilinea sp. P-1105 TaxID=2546229 RepID=UPI00146DFEFC|nr:COR domain-containing protein [Nodosilinea sp. P-1105]